MATRINTKFVITLVSVIVLMVLSLVFAVMFLKKTAEDHINLAEAAMVRAVDAKQQGDIEKHNSELERAAKHFGSAKVKDPANTGALYGFMDAHSQIICSNLTIAGNELNSVIAGASSLHDTLGASDDDRKVLYEKLHEHTRMALSSGGQSPVGAILSFTTKRLDVAPEDPIAQRYQAIALGYLAQQRTKDTEVAEDLQKITAAVQANPQNPWLYNALARYRQGNARRIFSAKGNTFTAEVSENFAASYESVNKSLALAQDNPPAYLEAAALLADVRSIDDELKGEITSRQKEIVIALDAMLADKKKRETLFLEELATAILLIQRVNIPQDEEGGEAFNGRKRAIALAEQLTKDRPQEPIAYRLLGEQQQQYNLFEDAAETLKTGLSIDRLTNAQQYIRDHLAKLEMMSTLADIKCTLALRSSETDKREALLAESTALLDDLAKADTLTPAQAEVRDARVNLIKGRIALAQRNPQLAVARLDEANLIFKNQNVQTLRYLAQAHAQLNNDAKLIGYYEAIIASGKPTIEDLLNLINLYLNPGENQQLARAENLLNNLQAQLPDDIRGIRLRARMHQIKGENDKALAVLQASLDKHPSLVNEIATIQAAGGDRSGVINIIRERLANTPEGEKMNLQLVSQLLNNLPDAEAKKAELKQLVGQGLDPEFAQVLGRILTSGKATLEDELKMVELLQEDPTDRALQKYLTYRKWNQEEKGRTFLDQAIKQSPDKPMVIEWRYKLALEDQAWEEAQQAIRDMLALPPNERTALAIADGRFMRAQVLASQAGLMEAGEARNKQIRDAVVSYNNALDEYSHYVQGWIQLARLYLMQENYFAAEGSLQEALNIQTRNTTALELLAIAQAASGNPVNALENFEQVLQIQPGNTNVLNQVTALAQQTGNSARAIQLREQVRDRVPGNFENRLALALLYAQTDDHAKAKATVQDVIESQGKTLQNIAVQCQVLSNNKEHDQAIQVAKDYLASRGDEATWRDHMLLAQVYEPAEKTASADQAYTKAIELEKPEGTLNAASSYGQALINRGQIAEAAQLFEGLIEQYPDNQQIKLRTAELYLGLQNFEKAEAIAKRMPASPERDRLMVRSASIQQGKLGIAIERAKQAVEAYPSDFNLRLSLVELLRVEQDLKAQDKRDYKESLAKARALVKDNPDRVEALVALTDVLLQMNRGDQAAVELKKALAFAPRHFGANERMARLKLAQSNQLAIKDPELSQALAREAATTLSMLLETRPDNAALLQTAGQAAQLAGQPAQAIDYYRRAFDAGKTEERLAAYVTTLLSANQGANARAVIDDPANATLVSNNLFLRALRGRAIAAAGRPDLATNLFSNLLKESKKASEQLLIARQVANTFSNEPMKAVTLLESALGEDLPVDIDRLLTNLLLNRSEHEIVAKRLLKYWNNPTQDVRNQISLLTQLALAQQESGQLTQSKATYDKVYAMWQQNKALIERAQLVQLLNNMSYLLSDQLTGYSDEAVRYAKQAVDLMSEEIDPPQQISQIEDSLGWAYHKAGKNDQAIQVLKRSIKRAPLVSNQLHLGQVYLSMGDKDKALLVLDAAMKQAKAQGNEKLFAEAQKYYREAL
jgi:tetratricopeptide (TPR) repeat protein